MAKRNVAGALPADKYCPGCELTLAVEMFSKDASKRDGLQSWCRACRQERARQYYQDHPEKSAARSRQWHLDHPEKSAARARQRALDHPGKSAARSRQWRLDHPGEDAARTRLRWRIFREVRRALEMLADARSREAKAKVPKEGRLSYTWAPLIFALIHFGPHSREFSLANGPRDIKRPSFSRINHSDPRYTENFVLEAMGMNNARRTSTDGTVHPTTAAIMLDGRFYRKTPLQLTEYTDDLRALGEEKMRQLQIVANAEWAAAKIEKTRIGRWPDKKWLAEFRAKAPALAVAAE